jgi:hypothetical protein
MEQPTWRIERAGRAWSAEEMEARYLLLPDKFEIMWGKLFWSDDDRLRILALLLENVGMDAAVRLGDRTLWRQALDDLDAEIADVERPS